MASLPCVINIKIPGTPAALEEFVARSADTAGLLKAIGETLVQVAQARFDSKTTPEGTAWAPNAPLTIMLSGGKGSMMQRSGALRNSIKYNVNGTSLSLGPNTAYAAVQNFGAVIWGPLRIPVPAGTRMNAGQAAQLGVGQKRSRGKAEGDVRATNSDGAIYLDHVVILARKYIGIGRKDRVAIAEAVEDWFSGGGQ